MTDIYVYLAGPDVFSQYSDQNASNLKQICAKYDLKGVFPLDTQLDLSGLSKYEAGLKISKENERLIRSCHGILANMTPFRGVNADVGTAYEMGYARALGKPVCAYSFENKDYKDRFEIYHTDENGNILDENMSFIEDFNMKDNLMLEGGVVSCGGQVIDIRSSSGKPGEKEYGCSMLDVIDIAVARLAKLLGKKYSYKFPKGNRKPARAF